MTTIMIIASAWTVSVLFTMSLCRAAALDVPQLGQKLIEGQCLPCWLYQHHECERGACRCPACGRGQANSRETREHA